jgi:hypothetical protein
LVDLRRLVAAVIAGNYEWEHRQQSYPRLFFGKRTMTQLVGTFHLDDGPWVFTRQGGEPPGATGGRTYAAY